MSENSNAFKVTLTVLLVIATSSLCFASESIELSGQVLDADALTPLSGARVLLLDPDQKILSSEKSDSNGTFISSAIPQETYQVAVEFDGTIYTLDQPLEINRGSSFIRIAIPALAPATTQDDEEGEEEDDDKAAVPAGGPSSMWSNPGTAAGIVVGGAFLLGWLIDSISDDEEPAVSPSTLPGLVLRGRI
jgi:hypothetical protein